MNIENEQMEISLQFEKLAHDISEYFDRAEAALTAISRPSSWDQRPDRDYFWIELPETLRDEADRLIKRLLPLAGKITNLVKIAPLASEADQRDIIQVTKAMRSAIFLRYFLSWDIDVLHDEGTVLGVQPPGQSDDKPCAPEIAKRIFSTWKEKVISIIDLLAAAEGQKDDNLEAFAIVPSRYKPRTAFIMMSMDKNDPGLIDVADSVKQVFKKFDINAVLADDIEHEDLITKRILSEIESSEYLYADLTGERPNVYYEVGYAHALKKSVILYRKTGTGIHFDLAGYNCPEYTNLHGLKNLLRRRLEHITNRKPKD